MTDPTKPEVMVKPGEAEANVYADVYKVLITGMLISTTLFAVGIVLALLHPRSVPLTPDWARRYYHWNVIAAGIRHGDPAVIMLIASVLLILTPVARVVMSIYAFAVDHDRKYVMVTSIVLLVMVATVILGLLGLK